MIELLGEIARDGDEHATVRFERRYPTTPADLWDALTSPERLVRWFAPVEGDLREGGEFTIHFDDGDVPRCRVVSCSPTHASTWERHHEHGSSLVEVGVESADDGGSVLRLVHSRLPAPNAAEYGAGWQAYVQSLTAYLDGVESGEWREAFGEAKAGYVTALAAQEG
ncbi:SRPBCC family protein [Nocardioides mangrovicus]|uniref:SRPBCC family protein n=1 Tax=Nocardioides mangrovicus TaxID=2478913 RepID=A0A3L8P0L6_9ACTN|nr:SRPBCC family protein [Nocardioides mangrovicus]RLV48990.1 SRPBCC family protein [Nocardioides mangrovicus]